MSSIANPIQFAIVREDPLIEKELVEKFKPTAALVMAGGGCTAFTLNSLFPDLKLTLVDPNNAQLQLIQRKSQALQRLSMDPGIVNIGSEDPQGLNACGNFEMLFRCLRDFWRAFVIRSSDLEHMFDNEKRLKAATEVLTSSKFWPVSFDLFFHDEMLSTLLGAGAVEHAPKVGNPSFFRQVIEEGLRRADALDNPFLHHMMLGHYLHRRETWPLYIQRPPRDFQAELLNSSLLEVTSFSRFSFLQLSNVFDWMSDSEVLALARRLDEELPSGAVILWRQMVKERDFTKFFARFKWEHDLAQTLLEKERSLYYTALRVGVKE